MEFSKYIKEELTNENIPILFIGSGITKRYCTIDGEAPPTWKELLKKIISIYNLEEFYYDLLEAQVKNKNKDLKLAELYQEVAEIVEKEFNESTYKKELKDKRIEEKILEEYRKTKVSPMKIYISLFFSKIEMTKDKMLLEEIERLKEIASKTLIIITTNYDLFLEKIFPEYKVIKGQELIKGRCVANILKVHGCITDPNTIIISKTDYEDISNRKKVLNARMITFFAEHPVIFLGYSLDDLNIQEFIDNIFTSFEKEKEIIKEISKKFLIIEWEKEKKETIVEDAIIMKMFKIPLKRISTDNYYSLFSDLKKLKININIKELALVEDIFLGAIKGNKKSRLKLINVNENYEETLDQDVIVGFGINILNMIYDATVNYYQAIGYNQKKIHIEPKDFFNIYLPDLCKRSSQSIHPCFKYLQEYNIDDENLKNRYLLENYKNLKKEIKKLKEVDISFYNDRLKLEDFFKEKNIGKTTKEIHLRALTLESKLDAIEIKGYINKELNIRKGKLNTNLRKLIGIVDYIEYSTPKIIETLEKMIKNS